MLFGAQKNQIIPHFTGEKSPCLRTIYPTGNPMWPFKTPERNGVYLRQSTMAVESPPLIIYRCGFPIKTPSIVGFKLPRLITRVTRGYSWTKNQQNGAFFRQPFFRSWSLVTGHLLVGTAIHPCQAGVFIIDGIASASFLGGLAHISHISWWYMGIYIYTYIRIYTFIYLIYCNDDHPIIPLNSKIWGQPVSFGSLVFPSPPLRSWHPDAASSKQDRSPKFVESREHLASIIPGPTGPTGPTGCPVSNSWENPPINGWMEVVMEKTICFLGDLSWFAATKMAFTGFRFLFLRCSHYFWRLVIAWLLATTSYTYNLQHVIYIYSFFYASIYKCHSMISIYRKIIGIIWKPRGSQDAEHAS